MASGPSGIQGGGLLDFLSVLLGFSCAGTNDDSFLPSATLPEILCFWAGEPHDLLGHTIKHLATQIREGNWASRRMSVPLTMFEDPQLSSAHRQAVRYGAK